MYNDNRSTILSRHGPVLVDVRVPVPEIKIWIDGPKMRIDRLRLVTSLPFVQGYEVGALRSIANGLAGGVRCGHAADQPLHVEILPTPLGPFLEIDVGPLGMYTSELVLRTKGDITLQALFDQSFAQFAGEIGLPKDYMAALLTIGAKRHDEHGTHTSVHGFDN